MSDQFDSERQRIAEEVAARATLLADLRATAEAQGQSIEKLVTIVDKQSNTITNLNLSMKDQRKFVTRFVSMVSAITLAVVIWLSWFVFNTVSGQSDGMEQFVKVLIDVNAYSVQCSKEDAPDIRVCMYEKLSVDQKRQRN